jgi:hypothetical protein
LNYVHGIAESLSYKAEFEYSHDHFQEAEEFSREALYWYKKTANKKRMAETYFTSAAHFMRKAFLQRQLKMLIRVTCFMKKARMQKEYAGQSYLPRGSMRQAAIMKRLSNWPGKALTLHKK